LVKVLTRHGICLSGLLENHLSLSMLVVFLNIHFLILVHFMLDVIMSIFWCDLCNSFDNDIESCPYYASYPQIDFALPVDNTNVVL